MNLSPLKGSSLIGTGSRLHRKGVSGEDIFPLAQKPLRIDPPKYLILGGHLGGICLPRMKCLWAKADLGRPAFRCRRRLRDFIFCIATTMAALPGL